MAHQRSVRGGRSWFGKREAKAAGRVSRRQVDAEAVEESFVEAHIDRDRRPLTQERVEEAIARLCERDA